jgi:hypothetical protein
MERSSAETLPERIDKPRFSTLTSRPKALVNSDSRRGRKLLTLIRNGRAMTAIKMRARTIPAILSARMGVLLNPVGDNGDDVENWMSGPTKFIKGR